jgi:hypothetical protein
MADYAQKEPFPSPPNFLNTGDFIQYKYGKLTRDYFAPNLYHIIFNDNAIVIHIDKIIGLFCDADYSIEDDYGFDSQRHTAICTMTLDYLMNHRSGISDPRDRSNVKLDIFMLNVQTNNLMLNINILPLLIGTYHQMMLFEYRNTVSALLNPSRQPTYQTPHLNFPSQIPSESAPIFLETAGLCSPTISETTDSSSRSISSESNTEQHPYIPQCMQYYGNRTDTRPSEEKSTPSDFYDDDSRMSMRPSEKVVLTTFDDSRMSMRPSEKVVLTTFDDTIPSTGMLPESPSEEKNRRMLVAKQTLKLVNTNYGMPDFYREYEFVDEESESSNPKKRSRASYFKRCDPYEILKAPFSRWSPIIFKKFILNRPRVIEFMGNLPLDTPLENQRVDIITSLQKLNVRTFAAYALVFYLLNKKFPKDCANIIDIVSAVYTSYTKIRYLNYKTQINNLKSFGSGFFIDDTEDYANHVWLAGLPPPNNTQDYNLIRREMRKYDTREYQKYFEPVTIIDTKYMVPINQKKI